MFMHVIYLFWKKNVLCKYTVKPLSRRLEFVFIFDLVSDWVCVCVWLCAYVCECVCMCVLCVYLHTPPNKLHWLSLQDLVRNRVCASVCAYMCECVRMCTLCVPACNAKQTSLASPTRVDQSPSPFDHLLYCDKLPPSSKDNTVAYQWMIQYVCVWV
jgi:hypothetical protein